MNDLNALFEQIARKELFIKTLETQGHDSKDFHDVAVWSLKAALRRAYEAGAQSAAKGE
tara:strand:+ start:697 stop:873 length:177 start_codon:yes stop_codon:yes gene_type:complete